MHPTQAHGTSAQRSFTHVAAPFDTDREYLALVLPRVRAALAGRESVLVVAGPRNLALLREGLGHDAGAIDTALTERWYDHPARSLNALVEYARAVRGRRVLLVGEQRWQGRAAREIREWIRRESVCNRVLAPVDGTALCLYDRRATPPEVMAAMYRTHPYTLIRRPAADGHPATGPPGTSPTAPPVPPAPPVPAPPGSPVSPAAPPLAVPPGMSHVRRRNDGYVPPESMVLEGDDKPFDDPPVWSEAIAFGPPTLKRLRDFVAARAHRAGMPQERRSALILCVAEIAANAVEHGAGRGRASIWVEDGELVCEICDPGGGLTDPFPGYLPPPEGSPRGYGLWLARQLCDLMEVRTTQGVSRIRLHMRLP